MPRLKHDRPGMTYACPACDRAGNIYERTGNGNPEDDRPFRCNAPGCGVGLQYVIERPKKGKGFNDGQTKLADLGERRRVLSREVAAMGPEDVGLNPIGVRGGAD